jgi:hypothetical protein
MRLWYAAIAVFASGAMAQTGLSNEERASFQAQVARCWNVGGAASPLPTITVTFAFDRQGKPLPDSLALVGAGKDTSDAVKSAYGAAKRAIFRCGAKGYQLPLEKFGQRRNMELTFNPERMSLR